MSLVRSKSLPGVGPEWDGSEEPSGTSRSAGGTSGGTRDSGVVVVQCDQASFASDARSSLLGDLNSGVACSDAPSEVNEEDGNHKNNDDPNKKATIGRHYYPEGGWGWVILTMALLVQISSHGFHQATGLLILHMVKEFPSISYISAMNHSSEELRVTVEQVSLNTEEYWITVES
ncbi:uncharacterized protein LOC135203474 [Macrobrachium nipponense]|uniref:uncharacterized protein LOC135203474 n=1 Tax=Macrobrachium nipponense TaxID=159736 RepID=UPI0030C7E1DA